MEERSMDNNLIENSESTQILYCTVLASSSCNELLKKILEQISMETKTSEIHMPCSLYTNWSFTSIETVNPTISA